MGAIPVWPGLASGWGSLRRVSAALALLWGAAWRGGLLPGALNGGGDGLLQDLALVGLGAVALALVLEPARGLASRLLASVGGAMATVLLLRLVPLAQAEGWGDRAVGVLGLALWLGGAALVLWRDMRQAWGRWMQGLTLSMLLTFLVGGAWCLGLALRDVYGAWPDDGSLLGPGMLVGLSLLTVALGADVWGRPDVPARTLPLDHRTLFVHGTALWMGSCVASGLLGAMVVTGSGADLVRQDLLLRAAADAREVERYVQRRDDAVTLAAAALGASSTPGRGALTLPLSGIGTVRVAADRLSPAPALPVVRWNGQGGSLLAGGGVRVQSPALPGLVVTVPPGEITLPMARLAQGALSTRVVLGPLGDPALGRCLTVPAWRAVDCPAGLATAPADAPRLQRAGPARAPERLVATAPLGEAGAVLVLAVPAQAVFAMIGRPLLAVLGGGIALTLLGAAWAHQRRLPVFMRLERGLADAQAVYGGLPLPVVLLDAHDRVMGANQAAVALYGAGLPALVGRPVADLLEARPAAADAVDAVGAAHPPADGAAPRDLVDAQGQRIPVETRVVALASGGRVKAAWVLRDLRGDLQALDDLRRWKTIFDQAGWGMAISSAASPPVLKLVNQAYASMLGLRPADLAGQPVSRFVASVWLDRLPALRAEAESREHVRFEMEHRRVDGREFPTLVDMTAVRDGAGRVLYYLVSVQDISELKRAELEVGQMAARLRAVLSSLPIGLWISDPLGRVERVNPMGRRLWRGRDGPAPDDGDSDGAGDGDGSRSGGTVGGDQGLHESLLRRAAVTGGRVEGGLREWSAGADGVRSVLTTAYPILDDHRGVIGAIAVDEDLSAVRAGERAAQEAAAQLERVLECATAGMAVFGADGRLRRCNFAWQARFEAACSRPGAPLAAVTAQAEEGDPLRQRDLAREIGADPALSYVGEHRLLRPDGRLAWALLHAARIPVPRGEPGERDQILLQVVDIDAQRAALDNVAMHQTRLAALQRVAGLGDFTWWVDAGEVDASSALRAMLDVDPVGGRRPTWDDLLAHAVAEDRERLHRGGRQALQTLGRLDEDCRIVRRDGREVELHFQGAMRHADGRAWMLGTVQDVTERKRGERELRRSQERLRELVDHWIRTIEDERKRIAREVHDELGQLLTALRMDVSMLRGEVGNGRPDLQARLASMRSTMETMTGVVRHVASHLRPAVLDHGLTAAIEWLAEDFTLRWELSCELDLPDDEALRLPEALALPLFRIVQESLTNIARHAQARTVTISLRADERALCLRVQDDGVGFDIEREAARRVGSLGLLGMRERALAIGARLGVMSRPGEGTIVELTCPFGPDESPPPIGRP